MEKNIPLKLTDKDLRRLQLTELEMVLEVDRICRKNNIKYVLGYGSMLGAVRHQGFIPWDDDVDIFMLREEYEKFCDACKNELDGSRFFLQNWETDKFFNSGYAKMRRLNSKFMRFGQEKMKFNQGIYIDIMPMDNLPDISEERVKFIKKCIIYRKILYSKAGSMCEKNILKRCGYKILSLIPRDKVKIKFGKVMQTYKGQNVCYCMCLGSLGKVPYCKEIFEERQEVDFEGYKIFIPKRPQCFLKVCYGMDYMTPPPEEERIQRAAISYIEFPNDNPLDTIR